MGRKRLKPVNTSKALGYIRVSTREQAKSGLGLEAQRDTIEAYCRMKGLELIDILVDLAESARKIPLDRRPEGVRLLQRLGAREVGSVVVVKLDRLFRRSADAMNTIERWDTLGIALHFIDFGGNTIDTSTPVGRMFITILSGFVQFEADLISERTSAALQAKIKRGEALKEIPFGFKAELINDVRMLVKDIEEQLTLNLIKQLRYVQGLSVPKIRIELNTKQIFNRGKIWHLTSLYRILNR